MHLLCLKAKSISFWEGGSPFKKMVLAPTKAIEPKQNNPNKWELQKKPHVSSASFVVHVRILQWYTGKHCIIFVHRMNMRILLFVKLEETRGIEQISVTEIDRLGEIGRSRAKEK